MGNAVVFRDTKLVRISDATLGTQFTGLLIQEANQSLPTTLIEILDVYRATDLQFKMPGYYYLYIVPSGVEHLAPQTKLMFRADNGQTSPELPCPEGENLSYPTFSLRICPRS